MNFAVAETEGLMERIGNILETDSSIRITYRQSFPDAKVCFAYTFFRKGRNPLKVEFVYGKHDSCMTHISDAFPLNTITRASEVKEYLKKRRYECEMSVGYNDFSVTLNIKKRQPEQLTLPF